MVQLKETRQVAVTPEQAFTYTADFTNLAQWDPGVAASSQIGTDPIGLGTVFDATVEFGSRETPMTYEITEFDPPNRVVLVGVGNSLRAVDDIRFRQVDGGTEVDYTADLEFRGLMKLFVPFMGRILRRVGTKALDGLAARLGPLK